MSDNGVTRIPGHKSVYMVARRDGSGYRRASRAEIFRMRGAGTIRLEGADGDEETNTVTYWYTREVT